MVTFINDKINRDDVANIKSTHISTFLQANNTSELKKIYDFYMSSQRLLVLTGFGGTGKRLLIEHSMGFLAPNVLRLEYDCKSATVCDDILLNFIDVMQKTSDVKKLVTPKIENFVKTFSRYVSICNFPIVIFINSFDNIQEKNAKLILDFLFSVLNYDKVKLIITGKTFDSNIIPKQFNFVKIISKPLNKALFIDYLKAKKVEASESEFEELYKYTRGYYYYTKLIASVLISTNLSVKDFLNKCKNSGKIFDKYLSDMAISALSIPIRNFFWFLLVLRHGISYDALSVFDLYDEMSVKHLLQNGYIYENAGTICVSGYFHSSVEILIPLKIKQKLHRYIVDMYKTQLHEQPEKRVLKLSRQSLNAEIDYHLLCADSTEEQVNPIQVQSKQDVNQEVQFEQAVEKKNTLTEEELFVQANSYCKAFKFTEAIEAYNKILGIVSDIRKKVDIFILLGRVYAQISEWSKSLHYYTLAQEFFENNKEPINVNYIKFELADVYYNTFNTQEARKTLRDVIYSQYSPKGLMLDACLHLGNIEDSVSNYKEAFNYYKQGIDSIDETSSPRTVQELYFRYAVALDEAGNKDLAIKYYNSYLATKAEDFVSPVYCNLGTLYEENSDIKTAEKYFLKAYNFDLRKNNYDGIYYASMHLANMYLGKVPKKALQYAKTAQNSAETLNDSFYIAQAHLLLGDCYYRMNDNENALKEYIGVYVSVKNEFSKENLKKITDRIRDMELRLGTEKYAEIMKAYG